MVVYKSLQGSFYRQYIYTYTYIYVCVRAVELKLVQLPSISQKLVQLFVVFVLLFTEISFYLQKEEDLSKTSKTNNQTKQLNKTQFYKLKIGPIMLRNMLGPVFKLMLGPVFNI